MRVVVSPNFDPCYCSFYFEGLIECFGSRSISFSRKRFPESHKRQSMAFRLEPRGAKIFIDARDATTVDEVALAWCDLYAKINVDPRDVRGNGRILPIGPSFGIQTWKLRKSIWTAFCTCCKGRDKSRKTIREHFAEYWRQYRYRLPLSSYEYHPSAGKFIFSLSSLWKRELRCNQWRASFVRACQSLDGIEFEGGFAPRPSDCVKGFERLTVDRRYGMDEYIRQLKRSLVAFNTPAVQSCHGWKLGEYLALGKATISTPLTRLLPAPLEHGKHIHLVDGTDDQIREAVERIVGDQVYRHALERNARRYFTEFLGPQSCIDRIVKSL